MNSFIELVEARASCRSYDSLRPVADELIEGCLAAARLAPSACNRQPWRFVVVDQRDTLDQLWRRCRLPGIDHGWLREAPVVVAICVALDGLTHRLAPKLSGIPYYLLDAGIAGEHLALAAAEVGLGTCWIGWFKARTVKKILAIPRPIKVVSLMTLGHPAEGWRPAEKKRLPLAEIAFHNRWRSVSEGLPQ